MGGSEGNKSYMLGQLNKDFLSLIRLNFKDN